ncbi:MAG TPA: helix-turn-helix transcriptional regulator [Polyangiaceae bacterium]|jgi:DNA-binding NarL/FixJ family response regulator|nr:helix-turn-helix transcriptional regulator [Polyangiaceae bacterium]
MSKRASNGREAKAIEIVIDGVTYLAIGAPTSPVEWPEHLSRAEREVAEGIAAGLSSGQIAKRRGTSVSTVSNQLHSLYAKLGIGSRAELLAFVNRTRRGGSARR